MIRLGHKLKNCPTDIIGLLQLSYFQIKQALTNLLLRSRKLSHTVRYLENKFHNLDFPASLFQSGFYLLLTFVIVSASIALFQFHEKFFNICLEEPKQFHVFL